MTNPYASLNTTNILFSTEVRTIMQMCMAVINADERIRKNSNHHMHRDLDAVAPVVSNEVYWSNCVTDSRGDAQTCASKADADHFSRYWTQHPNHEENPATGRLVGRLCNSKRHPIALSGNRDYLILTLSLHMYRSLWVSVGYRFAFLGTTQDHSLFGTSNVW